MYNQPETERIILDDQGSYIGKYTIYIMVIALELMSIYAFSQPAIIYMLSYMFSRRAGSIIFFKHIN